MTELRDINLSANQIVLKDNRVTSAVLPKNSRELEREVTIDGNVVIEGAVYANALEVNNGPAEFRGAVYSNREIHIKNSCRGAVKFVKSVATAGGLVSLLLNDRCTYGGDVNATSAKMKNCFVAGSVYAAEIQLENCVVLGGVFASKKLDIHSSVVGTFNAPEVNAGGINYLLYPSAFSTEPISRLPDTQFWNLSLADLGSLYRLEAEKDNTGKILMDPDNDVQKIVLTDDKGVKSLVSSFSISDRVIVNDITDFGKLENHFLIISASLSSQILKQYSLNMSDGTKGPELRLDDIADFFFRIITGMVQIKEMSGSVTLKELEGI